MHRVEPKVFLIGETRVIDEGLRDYLSYLGVPEWTTDAPSDAEKIAEVYGRVCYRSFKEGLNPNVTKIREGNAAYLGNILKVKHGSVLEHSVFNFVFADVSRVFTHELVRHRMGVAISQESLRFVRLDELGQWLPTVIREDVEMMEVFSQTFEHLEDLQRKMAQHYQLDDPDVPFTEKKVITSAMRRIAPIGLATSIGWSVNIRALRWVMEMRTHPSAEEEIRLVFAKVGEIITKRYPNVFGDFTIEMVDGLPHYKAANSKV